MVIKAEDLTVAAPSELAEEAPPSKSSIVLRKMWQLRLGVFGGLLLLGLVIVAVFAPYIATHNPFDQDILDRLTPPVLKISVEGELLGA